MYYFSLAAQTIGFLFFKFFLGLWSSVLSFHLIPQSSKSLTSVWCPTTDSFFFFLILFIYFYIYFWLCWVLASVRGPSPVAASGGRSSSQCAGVSPSRPLLLWSTGSRCTGSVAVAHGPSCSAACGILPDQGSNPCPLHWQADSQPLCHQGSPRFFNWHVFLVLEHVVR